MSWLEDELVENEEVVFRTHTHLYQVLSSVPVLLCGLIDLWLLIPGLALLAYGIIRYFYYEYVITDRRLIIKKGLFYVRSESIPHYNIEEVLIRRSIF